jgi:hypothetical protein
VRILRRRKVAMTKKDYVLVAKAIKAQKERMDEKFRVESEAMDDFAETMAAHFSLVNENFNAEVFLEAAGHGESSDD